MSADIAELIAAPEGKTLEFKRDLSIRDSIVFQIMILRRLEGGDHTGVYLRPITHSKSLSGKL